MRYRSFRSILPWMVVHPASHRVPRVPWYSGFRPGHVSFAYGGFTLCAQPSQTVPLKTLSFLPVLNPVRPKTSGLGSSLFARRYYGNHCCLLFLRLLRCFSSPGMPPLLVLRLLATDCSIRIFTAQSLLAAPRDFSQLIASFIGSKRLGIHRMPFIT